MADGILHTISQGLTAFGTGRSFADVQNEQQQREFQQGQDQFKLGQQEFTRGQQFLRLDDQRKKALFTDAREVNTRMKAGDLQGAMGVLTERVSILDQMGGDATDTLEIIGLLNSGDAKGAQELLDLTETVGIQQGFLQDLTPKRAAFKKGEKGLVFDPNSGTFTLDPIAKARFDEIATKKNQVGTIGLKDKQSINKDITGFIKNAVAIRSTAEDLDKLSKLGTGPAAIAAVFKFMKANDPTSTVREGEFATAEQSAGVPAQVTNFYNKLVTGERLTGDQIQQFVETSKVLANSAIGSATTEVDRFLNTFGEDLPVKFQRSVRKRTPDMFDITALPSAATTETTPATTQSFTSPSGISFTVGG